MSWAPWPSPGRPLQGSYHRPALHRRVFWSLGALLNPYLPGILTYPSSHQSSRYFFLICDTRNKTEAPLRAGTRPHQLSSAAGQGFTKLSALLSLHSGLHSALLPAGCCTEAALRSLVKTNIQWTQKLTARGVCRTKVTLSRWQRGKRKNILKLICGHRPHSPTLFYVQH